MTKRRHQIAQQLFALKLLAKLNSLKMGIAQLERKLLNRIFRPTIMLMLAIGEEIQGTAVILQMDRCLVPRVTLTQGTSFLTERVVFLDS